MIPAAEKQWLPFCSWHIQIHFLYKIQMHFIQVWNLFPMVKLIIRMSLFEQMIGQFTNADVHYLSSEGMRCIATIDLVVGLDLLGISFLISTSINLWAGIWASSIDCFFFVFTEIGKKWQTQYLYIYFVVDVCWFKVGSQSFTGDINIIHRSISFTTSINSLACSLS